MLIKICGIDDPSLVKAILKLKVNLMGVVCTPTSKRFLGMEKAMEIIKTMQKEKVKSVLVFRNESLKIIASIVKKVDDCIVQFQAENHPEREKLVASFDTITSFPSEAFFKLDTDVEDLIHIADGHQKKTMLLIDGKDPGSGKTFCWDTFKPPKFPWFLAGGLNVSNVNQAIHQLKPTGIDVSTGVEDKYGKKDLLLITKFIEEIKKRKINEELYSS